MSSWKKAAKSNQKVHRERHQPEARKHLGLLEKKKDYKLRAIDAQRKEKALQILHRRALDRNPDEFYHHMINARTQDGEHFEKEKPDEHTKEQLALMETQDMKYITMKRTIEIKKIQRLRAQLHMIDEANETPKKHIYFVDNAEEDEQQMELSKRLEQLDNKKQDTKPQPALTAEELKKANALKKSAYQELAKRIERERELAIVQQKIQLQRRLQSSHLLKPKKEQPGTKTAPPVYRFKYERKK